MFLQHFPSRDPARLSAHADVAERDAAAFKADGQDRLSELRNTDARNLRAMAKAAAAVTSEERVHCL